MIEVMFLGHDSFWASDLIWHPRKSYLKMVLVTFFDIMSFCSVRLIEKKMPNVSVPNLLRQKPFSFEGKEQQLYPPIKIIGRFFIFSN